MAKEAYELARKGGVAPAVLQDISVSSFFMVLFTILPTLS
jgi:hypothetical protein